MFNGLDTDGYAQLERRYGAEHLCRKRLCRRIIGWHAITEDVARTIWQNSEQEANCDRSTRY